MDQTKHPLAGRTFPLEHRAALHASKHAKPQTPEWDKLYQERLELLKTKAALLSAFQAQP